MPREPRHEVPGGYFHVSTRGVNGDAIFFSAHDRVVFLTWLARTTEQYDWLCIAYCLMGNQYHLVIQTPEPTLARGMQFLNGGFAQATNHRYEREGHLFGRRYWCELLETEAHLLETSRYVVLNPVRARICDTPAAWPWSSYRATLGLVPAPSFLALDVQLCILTPVRTAARDAYYAFVEDGRMRIEQR
jgi:REP element-mobilizing transposase RayT